MMTEKYAIMHKGIDGVRYWLMGYDDEPTDENDSWSPAWSSNQSHALLLTKDEAQNWAYLLMKRLGRIQYPYPRKYHIVDLEPDPGPLPSHLDPDTSGGAFWRGRETETDGGERWQQEQ